MAKLSFLDKLEMMARGQARLAALSRTIPELSGLVIGDSLQAKPGRVVISARLNGAPVIAKFVDGPGGADEVKRMEAALARRLPRMQSGPFRVPRPVHFAPDEGLAVIERVPGRRLQDLLAEADESARRVLLSRAAGWLGAYAAGSEKEVTFGVRFWAKNRAEAAATGRDAATRAVTGAIADRLAEQVPVLSDRIIRQALIHGDFTPLNMLMDETAVWGVDLSLVTHWPVVRDVATMLVFTSTAHPVPRPLWGVDPVALDALLSTGLLDEHPPGLLRFWTGVKLSMDLLSLSNSARRRGAALDMAEHWLADRSDFREGP
ncbi:phosphotransferase [Roseicyclus sp. F158]|uniref:Phosphotransferase n=1 Tax=Tropicimonas omnivorans TaxID=3075590 RepID=A0ABU3DFZ8_9RHOB|nr:phosphotransferase [Roseicyclus sp. F158]MDT0682636.1 phosphotransferase [Roseicyclus sp. F158]